MEISASRLDRVAERRAGAMRLDHVDVARREPGIGERSADHALLGGPFGAVRPLLAPSWLIALPRTHRQHPVPAAAASERRSSTSNPAPSENPVPSAAAAKGLQRPSAASAALAAEADEDRGRREDGDAAGERQRALARAQRLAGQMQRHERGGAGRVDRQRRALESQRIGDASRDNARGAAR